MAQMIIPSFKRLTRLVLLSLTFLSISVAAKLFDGFNSGPILCPIRLLTGIPCPACGTTRSIGALCEGKFTESWRLNPLGYFIAFAALVWAVRIPITSTILNFLSKKYNTYSSRSRFVFLITIYIATWILNLMRINNGIL